MLPNFLLLNSALKVVQILYLVSEAYIISFQQQHSWAQGIDALPFQGIIIGVIFGYGTTAYITKSRFKGKFVEHRKVIPEERLPPMSPSPLHFEIDLVWHSTSFGSHRRLPIGRFIFASISSPSLPWAPLAIAGIPMVVGIIMFFMQCLNYIIDAYKFNANSPISANVLVRSIVGGSFPVFVESLYGRLGIGWGRSY